MIKSALAAVSKKTEVPAVNAVGPLECLIRSSVETVGVSFPRFSSLTMSAVIRESLEWSSAIFPKIHDASHIKSLGNTWNLYFPTQKSVEPLLLTCIKSLPLLWTFTWTHQICAHICTISSNNEEIGEFFLHRSFAHSRQDNISRQTEGFKNFKAEVSRAIGFRWVHELGPGVVFLWQVYE